MIGSGFLKNLFAGKGADIIESVGAVADKFITTPHEKNQFNAEVNKEINRHLEAAQTEANKELALYLADTANARDMNAKVQDSDKASWLSKNIAYIIDAVIVVSFISMLVLIYHKAVPEENKELFYTGFGVLGAMLSTVLNFHRGTSIGSERKQKQLDKLRK
jgi:hypothetical protein